MNSALCTASSPNQVIHQQLTLRFLDDLATQVVAPQASTLERLMGERILVAFVNLHVVHAKQLSLDDDLLNEQSLPVHAQMNRRLDAAYRNLDTALKGLQAMRERRDGYDRMEK